MNIASIVDELEKGSNYNEDDVTVTFKEGLNMRAIAKLISDNTNNTYDSVFDTLADKEYIESLVSSYWFLSDTIENTNIYYPLEGYLFPDTYTLNKKNSVKDIFKLMLDKMDIELTKYKLEITESKYSIHEIMTLASIVELEAGHSNDRALVAGVFYNRLSQGVTLGSDVTGYYAYKMDDWSKGLPAGPICNPGNDSIKAVLEPTTTSYLFFVADCDGNTYLTKTNAEHEAKVDELKSLGKWCDQ